MVSDLDIWRTAKLLVDRHGSDAPVHAALRADTMLERGDLEGLAAWKRILAAARELLNTTAAGSVH